MEFIEDKEGRSIKIFKPEEIEKTTQLIKDTFGIKKVNDRPSNSTSSHYLKFKYNGHRYDIRIADLTYLIPKDQHKIVLNCTYKRADNLFTFEASVYNYTPEDIVKAVQLLDNSIKFFKSDENKKDILSYVKDNYNIKDGDVSLDSNLYPYNVAMELAGRYMEEKEIDDNKYNTNFIGLVSIIENMIARIKSKDY